MARAAFSSAIALASHRIASACGRCAYCRAGLEDLCPAFQATGRDVDGGYAEYLTVAAAFAHPIPDALGDVEAAPLLCAGAIGYRSLMLAGLSDGENLGLTGFGACRAPRPAVSACALLRAARSRLRAQRSASGHSRASLGQAGPARSRRWRQSRCTALSIPPQRGHRW